MAVPKWHLGVCVVLVGTLTALSRSALWSWHTLWIVVFGCLVDLDHCIQWKRTKLLIKGIIQTRTLELQKEWHKTEPEHLTKNPPVNICHTWLGAIALVLIAWLLIKSWIPIIAYSVHILIDCFDGGYSSQKRFLWEIPDVLGRFVPPKWRYNKS